MNIEDIRDKTFVDTFCDGCCRWSRNIPGYVYRIRVDVNSSYTYYSCLRGTLSGHCIADVCSIECLEESLQEIVKEHR